MGQASLLSRLLSIVPFLYPICANARHMALTKKIATYAFVQIMKISGSSMEVQSLDCQRP